MAYVKTICHKSQGHWAKKPKGIGQKPKSWSCGVQLLQLYTAFLVVHNSAGSLTDTAV